MDPLEEKKNELNEKPEVEEVVETSEANDVEEVSDAVEDTWAEAIDEANESFEEMSDSDAVSGDLKPVEVLAADIVDHVELPKETDAEDVQTDTEDVPEETVEEVSEVTEETSEEDSKENAEESVEEAAEKEAEESDVPDEVAQDDAVIEAGKDAAVSVSEDEISDEEKEALSKDQEETAKERSAIYVIFDTLRYIAIGLLVGILLVVFVIQRNDVYGSSMEPTLHTGDAVFVEMISVYTGNLDRGDIVTIDARGMDGYTHEENLIKRIVGLPGETIKIEDGNVYINGVLLDESDYLPEGTKTYVGAEGQARGYQEITLGPDEYYCMGDNRGGSNDSRRMGPFKKERIEAKVLMRIYPFNKIELY